MNLSVPAFSLFVYLFSPCIPSFPDDLSVSDDFSGLMSSCCQIPFSFSDGLPYWPFQGVGVKSFLQRYFLPVIIIFPCAEAFIPYLPSCGRHISLQLRSTHEIQFLLLSCRMYFNTQSFGFFRPFPPGFPLFLYLSLRSFSSHCKKSIFPSLGILLWFFPLPWVRGPSFLAVDKTLPH